MKKLILIIAFVTQTMSMITAGMLTNNGNVSINIVMYNNYNASKNGKSATGRIRNQGYIIPPGQNIDIEKAATSIDVFYSDLHPGIHASINASNSYTISPDSPTWIITQD